MFNKMFCKIYCVYKKVPSCVKKIKETKEPPHNTNTFAFPHLDFRIIFAYSRIMQDIGDLINVT